MNTTALLHNQKGTTLIEAMIAMAILTIGILTVMVMQVRAIDASSSAMNRTEANTLALALLETFKNLPFDNANLTQTTATFAELTDVSNRVQLQALIDANKVRTLTAAGLVIDPMKDPLRTAAGFWGTQPLVQLGAVNGTVVDSSGITYQLAWAVQDQILAPGKTLDKTIWLFVYWNSLMGQNRLQMTTVKYSNVPL